MGKTMNIKKCQNLAEIRSEIDALDGEIIPLLCERIQYILQAAQFKADYSDVRQFGRIEAIVERARATARVTDAPEDYIESVYRFLIDESIRQESKRWFKLNDD